MVFGLDVVLGSGVSRGLAGLTHGPKIDRITGRCSSTAILKKLSWSAGQLIVLIYFSLKLTVEDNHVSKYRTYALTDSKKY